MVKGEKGGEEGEYGVKLRRRAGNVGRKTKPPVWTLDYSLVYKSQKPPILKVESNISKVIFSFLLFIGFQPYGPHDPIFTVLK